MWHRDREKQLGAAGLNRFSDWAYFFLKWVCDLILWRSSEIVLPAHMWVMKVTPARRPNETATRWQILWAALIDGLGGF